MSEPALSAAARFLGTLPMFSDLTESEIEELAWTARPFRLDAGDFLCRQGAPADEMFCIASGRLSLSVRVGGTEETRIAVLEAGSIVGESALVERGVRSASVVVLEQATGYALHRRGFDVLRATFRPSAAKVLRRLASLVSERLAGAVPDRTERPAGAQLRDMSRFRAPAVELDRENLQRLPPLASFTSEELEVLLRATHKLTLPRGTVLFHEHDPPGASFITVRGAVEISIERDGRRQKLALQGPGKMFGEAGLFSDRNRAATCSARENSVLLELDRAAFDRLFQQDSVVAFKLLDVAVGLLIDLMRKAATRQVWFRGRARPSAAPAAASTPPLEPPAPARPPTSRG